MGSMTAEGSCPKGHDRSAVEWQHSRCSTCRREAYVRVRPMGRCRNGHDMAVVGRDASGWCIACKKDYDRRYYLNHRDKQLAKARAYRDAKPIEVLAEMRHQEYLHRVASGAIARYQNSPSGQLADAKYQTRRRIQGKEARIAELETMLNGYA